MAAETGTDIYYDTEEYRDSIATVDSSSGRRIWITPKQPKGKYYNYRTYLSWFLLLILFGLPFIKVNGEPFVLLNVLDRHFILFGIPFVPQDFHLFVLVMLTGMVFIVLFTAIFGRLFCGWVCPQTIFMEMVFRKIEYWIEGDGNAQRRLNKAPWTADKIRKKVTKQAIFIAISVLIAHTFLSYIIGVEAVWEIVTHSPSNNWMGFFAMVAFTSAFYFVFSYMREQVCIAICPYGRLQGVLLDKNSISVMYDWVRGEPRGKLKRQKKKPKVVKQEKEPCEKKCVNCRNGEPCPTENMLNNISQQATSLEAAPVIEEPRLGDCIDCKLCIHVCPTGIDIRNGTQLECVGCTACIDACDEVMLKIGRPTGLIRYDSYEGISEKRKKIFTPRVMAYAGVLLVLMAVNIILLNSRTEVETLFLRTPGMLYQRTDDGYIRNLYNYQIINKTNDDLSIEFRLADEEGRMQIIGEMKAATANEVTEGAIFIDFPPEYFSQRKNEIDIEIWLADQRIDQVSTNFLGPNRK